MRTLFHSPEFWAPQTYRARIKTPFEFVASALRASQADVTDPTLLLSLLNKMGQPLYGMQPPTGYSTRADVWVNSAALLERMNFGLALTANRLAGSRFDVNQLLNSGAGRGTAAVNASTGRAGSTNAVGAGTADPYQAELKLEQILLAGGISKQTHDVIEQRMVASGQDPAGKDSKRQPDLNLIAGLLLGSPEFQRK
jgi:hypothetical protein